MKVVNPLDVNHTITIVPRYYPTETLTLELIEEAIDTKNTVNCTYTEEDSLFKVHFTYDFTGKDKYSIKILEENNVIYRGKLMVSEQNTQDYKQTNGLYYYE